jgi:hypothetical protein
MHEFFSAYSVGAAWGTTAALFFLTRLLMPVPSVFVTVALAAVFTSVFGFLFPWIHEVWSFAVFVVFLFPMYRLCRIQINKKRRSNGDA